MTPSLNWPTDSHPHLFMFSVTKNITNKCMLTSFCNKHSCSRSCSFRIYFTTFLILKHCQILQSFEYKAFVHFHEINEKQKC